MMPPNPTVAGHWFHSVEYWHLVTPSSPSSALQTLGCQAAAK